MSQLLAQGGFGCIYYPGLEVQCPESPNDENSVVTKIQAMDDVARNEIMIGQHIRKADNFVRFFLPVINSCPLNVQGKNDLAETCDIISDVSKKYMAMDIPHMDEVHFATALSKMSTQRKILTLIDTYTYLLHALVRLNKLDIVQYDLKFGNVLFRKLTNEPRLSISVSRYTTSRS